MQHLLPSNSDYELQEYSFNTQAELDAFMHGVDESNGWHSYNVIGKNGDFATLADLKEYYGDEGLGWENE